MRVQLFAPILACGIFLACQSGGPATQAEIDEERHAATWLENGSDGSAPTIHALPSDWLEGSANGFAKKLAAWELPWPLLWNLTSQEQLIAVLLDPSTDASKAQNSVRAALLLARDPSPPSQSALLIRLERRLAPLERGRQGVELVCASALGKQESLDPKTMLGLLKLATGKAPHPDLDVRVECARAYLAHIPRSESDKPPMRARTCLGFLIKVLRAETPAQAGDPPTWKRVRTVAWPKGRASEELQRWFEAPGPFLPDGSWQHQVDWAKAAETALGLQS